MWGRKTKRTALYRWRTLAKCVVEGTQTVLEELAEVLRTRETDMKSEREKDKVNATQRHVQELMQ